MTPDLYRGVPTPRPLSSPELRELARRIADELHARPPVLSLSVEHAAEAIGVGETLLRDLMDAGHVKFVKFGDHRNARRVIRISELEALLLRFTTAGKAVAS